MPPCNVIVLFRNCLVDNVWYNFWKKRLTTRGIQYDAELHFKLESMFEKTDSCRFQLIAQSRTLYGISRAYKMCRPPGFFEQVKSKILICVVTRARVVGSSKIELGSLINQSRCPSFIFELFLFLRTG